MIAAAFPDHDAAVEGRDQPGEKDLALVVNLGVRRDRHLAAAFQGAEQGPFGPDREPGTLIMEKSQAPVVEVIIDPGFDAQGALGNRRQRNFPLPAVR